MKYTLLQQKIRLCTAGVSQPCWQGSPYQPIPVSEQVPAAVALQIMENQSDYPGVTAQAQPVTHYVQPFATASGADPGLPAADHAAGGGAAPPAGDRLLRGGPGRPGGPGAAVRPAASRHPGHADADRQRGGHGHRDPPPGQPQGRRHPGDQPQLPAPGGHLQRADPGHPARAGRGQHRRHQRRGRGDDHHRPGPRHGQLPDLRPQHLERRHLQPGVQEPVRHRARRADTQPGHPGRVRPRIHLEGHLHGRRPRPRDTPPRGPTAARGRSRSPATRSTTGPRPTSGRCRCTRRWSCPATRCSTSSPTRCTCTTATARTSSRTPTRRCRRCRRWRWPGGSATTPGSTCRSSHPAPSPPGSGCTTTGSSTRTTGASTATPTAATSSRSPTTTAGPGTSGRPARPRSPRSARAT